MNLRQWLEERKVAKVSPTDQDSIWDADAWFQGCLENEVQFFGFHGGDEVITVGAKLLLYTPLTGTLYDEQFDNHRIGLLSLLIDWHQHTAASLAQLKVFDAATGLHIAVQGGELARIDGSATLADLAGAKNKDGFTALHEAARCNHLDLIAGGVTAAQLAVVKDVNGRSALHVAANYGHLRKIKGGVTATQLVADADNRGISALHAAAENPGLLSDVAGGVTADQLANVKDNQGYSALHCAAEAANQKWADIVGGVTIEQLASSVYVPIGTALYMAVRSDNLKGVQDAEAQWLNKPETEDLLKAIIEQVPHALTERIADLLAVAQAARLQKSRGARPETESFGTI